MAKPSTNIPDKGFNFPNPKFISFMRRMWNSEPVSQTEKDNWDEGGGTNPHSPIIIVDQVAVNLAANASQTVFDIDLPDLGDDINIALSASGSSIEISNSGIFEISGIVKIQESFIKYDFILNINTFEFTYISKTQNESQASPTRANGDKEIDPSRILCNPNIGVRMIVFFLKADVATNKLTFSLRLDTASLALNGSVLNRIEIRRL